MLELPKKPTEDEILAWRCEMNAKGYLGIHPNMPIPMEYQWLRDCEQVLMGGLAEFTTADAKSLLNRVLKKIESKAYEAGAATKVGAA